MQSVDDVDEAVDGVGAIASNERPSIPAPHEGTLLRVREREVACMADYVFRRVGVR
jgi:hypothetical protein